MMNDNIVFEFTEKAEGSFGIRKRMGYSEENTVPNDLWTILGNNVSEHQALSLISQTPEICWIMGAVDQACDQLGNASFGILSANLLTAVYAVIINREFRATHGLGMIDADKYIEFHEYRAYGKSMKSRLIAAVLDSSENGYVNLETLTDKITLVITDQNS